MTGISKVIINTNLDHVYYFIFAMLSIINRVCDSVEFLPDGGFTR